MNEAALKVVEPRRIGGVEIIPVSRRLAWLNVLIYGEPGAGKTVLSGSASAVPEMSPVLLIDVEGGSLSLSERYPNVDLMRVATYEEVRKAGAQLKKEDCGGYRTIIIDSLSEIAKLSMVMIMKQVIADDPGRDPDVPSVREWGKNLEQMRRIVRFFRDLDCHVIFTCHETDKKDERTGGFKTGPALSGKLAHEIAGFVDEVFYLYTKARTIDGKPVVKRFLLTSGEGSKIAKDRSDKLPLVIDSPTMETVYNTIFKPKAITTTETDTDTEKKGN